MEKINEFEFRSNGVTIMFRQAEPTPGEIVPKFFFFVQNNLDLTNKILDAVNDKKVKKNQIDICALSLFQIIEKGKVIGRGPIKITESYVEKGAVGEEYYNINLIHTQGLLTKSFKIKSEIPMGVRDDWENIFFLGEQKEYAVFLQENFAIKMPKSLMDKPEPSEIDDFGNQFIFKEGE